MRVERFLADDMRQAMSRVREKFGSDALILSNRRINGQTEIIAAADDVPVLNKPVRKPEAVEHVPEPQTQVRKAKRPVVKKGQKGPGKESLSDIKMELSRLRNMFEGELSQLAWRDAAVRQLDY